MEQRHFSTIRAMIPASDYFAVYAAEEAPFYALSRLQCLVAGRTVAKIDPRTGAVIETDTDDLAFMDIDRGGVFDDPTNASNFLAICHERDITEENKADWTQRGKAHHEKNRRQEQRATPQERKGEDK